MDANNNILLSSKKNKYSRLSELTKIAEDELFLHKQNKKKDIQEDSEDYNFIQDEENEPTQNTYRGIFYESCRGLEAWSVICLDLDTFYQRKKNEEIAASYMSDDLFLTEDERRTKYAATWVLMALTRPLDTLYVHIRDPDSELGKIFQKYLDQ